MDNYSTTIDFMHFSEAETCLRRFNEDYPIMKVFIEFAKTREVSAQPPVNYDFVELERSTDTRPFRNRLELSKRY